jgi:hypothetical protein
VKVCQSRGEGTEKESLRAQRKNGGQTGGEGCTEGRGFLGCVLVEGHEGAPSWRQCMSTKGQAMRRVVGT